MLVSALIAIMIAIIAIVVGVNLLPVITDSITSVTNSTGGEPLSPALSGLLGALPYVFVAVILLGVVAWLGGFVGGDKEEKEARQEKVKAFFKNPREVILRIENSSKNWKQYINNLDDLLGIKTMVGDSIPNGLLLNADKELWIDSAYHWYIADKYPDQDIFKVVGLSKEDASENKVYILGISKDSHKAFLTKVPTEYLEASCKQCCDWSMANPGSDLDRKWFGEIVNGIKV